MPKYDVAMRVIVAGIGPVAGAGKTVVRRVDADNIPDAIEKAQASLVIVHVTSVVIASDLADTNPVSVEIGK